MKVEALALAKLRDCFVRVFERCFFFWLETSLVKAACDVFQQYHICVSNSQVSGANANGSLTVIDKRMVMRLSGEELWKVVETIISLAFGANAISLKSQKQERKKKHLSKTLTKQSLSLAKAKASTFMYIK